MCCRMQSQRESNPFHKALDTSKKPPIKPWYNSSQSGQLKIFSQSNTSERESRTRYRTAFMCSLIHWLGLRFYEAGWTKFQNHFTVLNVVKLRTRYSHYFVKLDRKYHFHHRYSAVASKPSLRFRRSIHFLWLVKQMTCESRGVENLRFDHKHSGQCLPS